MYLLQGPSSNLNATTSSTLKPKPPSQDRMVNEYYFSRLVTPRDICCDLISTFVGVAFVLAAVAGTYFLALNYGWSLKMAIIYSGVGMFGCTSILLTFVSIKRLIINCKKMHDNRKAAGRLQ